MKKTTYPAAKYTVPLVILVRPEQHDKLRAIAEAKGCSMAAIVRQMIGEAK